MPFGNCVLEYNPRTDKYLQKAKLPIKEWLSFDVTSCCDSSGNDYLVQVNKSDIPSTDSNPQNKDSQALLLDATSIYLHGGTVATGPVGCKLFYRYDYLTDTFHAMPMMVSQRRRCAAVLAVEEFEKNK